MNDAEFLDRLDPALRPILESDLIPPLDFTTGAVAARERMIQMREMMAGSLPDIPNVKARDVVVPGFVEGDPEVTLRVYEPDDRTTTAILYWIHGGGMVAGRYDLDEFQSKTFASKFGCVVVSVEYRLAPEDPYPAPLHDCYAGLQWVHREATGLGGSPDRIVIAGASAGGGLAAGLALLARDRGEVPVAAQMLIFPMIDDRDQTASNQEIVFPKCWNRPSNVFGWKSYLGDLYGGDVPLYAAPARATSADLRSLPPAYIDVGELDAFRDEDIEYAQKLLAAGVACELLVTPGAFHASEGYNPQAPSSKRITRSRLDWLSRALAP
ncbi:MAG: alpha/beta hydrolase [Acidimicrobiales bacterium]|nr:alpha/beta hydrolase [Acidimicrobiales bacterium]